MVSEIVNLWISFIAGLSAPLAAVCVLPIYPAFLAYLSNQLKGKESRRVIISLGFVAALGIILSLFVIGLVFTFLLSEPLASAVGVISPIAFVILAIVSLMMIFNFDFTRIIPTVNVKNSNNPWVSAFVFGLFFGLVVLPCNPGPLIVLFAISSSVSEGIFNLLNFVSFGIGMSLPLIVFAFISGKYSESIMGWLARNKRKINLVTGIIMLGISIYYLFLVFRIHELLG